ncbi:conserved hypothetical protein [Ricinus communis]|uniref:Uncharacterized protein n=1 Tax=Ricinus communis TaxID=3988 RepID=B9T5J3_RICCO|nr:conserved hypothetical protein [Ricinus communis]
MDKGAQVNENAEEAGKYEVGDIEVFAIVGSQTNDMAGQEDILNDSKGSDYKPVEVSKTNDGIEDSDFSLEDEEHLEARRNFS